MALSNVLSVLLFVLITTLVTVLIQTFIHLGYFKIVLNHSPGPCRVIQGPNSFYLTNWLSRLGTKFKPIQLMEIFLRIPLSNIVYYDGKKSRVVVTGIPTANGINIDSSGKYVFVNAWVGGYVAIYERHQDSSLKELQKIHLGFSPDNINVDVENGDLWIAGMPNIFEFWKYFNNVTRPSSSRVVNVRLEKLPNRSSSTEARVFEYEARDVYTNDGRQVKATSAAVHYKGKILVGTVFDNILLCELQAY